ncbi:hypothetical protein NW762_012812 [Fusarium torreyae]|uniref:Peptidase S8/S53 domain-containing protein n=1 Tax=Fusarium torreyae TaxID=1237075 RepID=A0A9W8V8H2_9HYPO|nr:hypothetical protein NW762_012812 [Fusarium torreyae]
MANTGDHRYWGPVFSVGTVNIKYGRWYRPPRGILPARGSNHNKRLNAFAPGELILSASINCTTCYERMNGTSQAAPHVAGIMATIVDYEGWQSLDHAKKVYQRVRENTISHVNIDAAMDKAGTTNKLVQTGIVYLGKHPYHGVPDDEQIPLDNNPLGPSQIGMERPFPFRQDEGTTHKEEPSEPDPAPDIPKQIVESDDNSDRLMQVGDEVGFKPKEPDSSDCFGLGTNHYVTREPMVAAIDKFSSTMVTPDEVQLTIQFETPEVDYAVDRDERVFYLKDMVLDRCDSSNVDNPPNFKAGGVAKKGQVSYHTEPRKARRPASKGLSAGCKVDTNFLGPRKIVSKVRVWGAGWATSDVGQAFGKEASECGVQNLGPAYQFKYEGGDDDREWSAELDGQADVSEKCIAEAIKKSGAPEVTCEKVLREDGVPA